MRSVLSLAEANREANARIGMRSRIAAMNGLHAAGFTAPQQVRRFALRQPPANSSLPLGLRRRARTRVAEVEVLLFVFVVHRLQPSVRPFAAVFCDE